MGADESALWFSPCPGETFLPVSLDGSPNRGFSEQVAARFEYRGSLAARLFIDDFELTASDCDAGITWSWTPGFFAGTVMAELVVEGVAKGRRFFLDVSPHREKMGQEAYRDMLREVWHLDPDLIVGFEPGKGGIGHGGRSSHLAITLGRVMQNAGKFLYAVERLRDAPHSETCSSRALVPPSQCRKVDLQTVRSGLGVLAPSLGRMSKDRIVSRTPSIAPVLDVPLSTETLDTPANRSLLAMVLRLEALVASLSDAFEREVEREQEDPTRTSLALRWPRRKAFLERFAISLRQMRRSSPLKFASRPETSAAGLVALSGHPNYARAYRLGTVMLRTGIEGLSPSEISWMSPTWGVYEAWCYVKTLELFRRAFPKATWRRKALSNCDRCYEADEVDTRISLHFQQRFPSGGRTDEKFASLSAEFRPDIIIWVRSPGMSRWVVLDAKYRVSRSSVLEGMGSSHLYHDALKVRGQSPDLSLLLLPAEPQGTMWLTEDDFQQRHGVGAVVFAPGQASDGWLVHWLRACSQG